MKPQTLSKTDRKNTNKLKASKNKLRVIKNAKHVLDGITICNFFVPEDTTNGWGNSLVFNGTHPIKVSSSLAWHLENIRVKWEVTCGVLHRDQQGKHFLEYVTIQADRECYSNDVSEQTQKICAWLFKHAYNLTKICPFWLAVPRSSDKPVDLTLVYRTAHHHKILNRMGTNFEINCNLPIVDYHSGAWFDIPKDWDKTKELDFDMEKLLSITLITAQTENGKEILLQYTSK